MEEDEQEQQMDLNDQPPPPDCLELQLLKKVRLALAATLHMLECIRDDVHQLGQRMDRLSAASQQCRQLLQERGHLRRSRRHDSSDRLTQAARQEPALQLQSQQQQEHMPSSKSPSSAKPTAVGTKDDPIADCERMD